jgi:ferritin-like metal-binding protein YciE
MVNQANNRLNDREKHIEYLEEVIKSQKINTETENNAFQKIIENLKQ